MARQRPVPGQALISASVVLVACLAPGTESETPPSRLVVRMKRSCFEIGAMIFGITVGDERCPLPTDATPASVWILATEANAGRVVVEFLEG